MRGKKRRKGRVGRYEEVGGAEEEEDKGRGHEEGKSERIRNGKGGGEGMWVRKERKEKRRTKAGRGQKTIR